MQYEAVIGLEIHAQLLTTTKVFCGCSTAFGSSPNTNVCPVCLGFPGALPVLNGRAVELAARAALALGCDVHGVSIFARKNYFYPDLPKGYQISQYEQPLATAGRLTFDFGGEAIDVGITRVHMEEDAGKSLHEGLPDSDRRTHLDFNRSGVPLIEIVTEPDLRSAASAARCFEQLREILVSIGVNDGNMEEGSLRCDANVSVRPVGDPALGVKTEVKNLNSFRFVRQALEHELERQTGVIAAGGRVVQETRLWNVAAGRTESMRSKEEAHDYRYFPEPDLPPLCLESTWIAGIRRDLPELPETRRRRFVEEYRLPAYDAGVLTRSDAFADYFERTARASANAKAASNWIMGELSRKLNEEGRELSAVPIAPDALADLIKLVDAGTISGSIAKQVFETMYATGRPAKAIVEAEGLSQIDDEAALAAIVARVIAEQPKAVQEYREGNARTLGFLVGQVMKASRGKADPRLVNTLLERELDRK